MKKKIKTCEYCGKKFVDDTKYNQLSCGAIPCNAKYIEWVHGDKDSVKSCQRCGSQYHPHWLSYFEKGICWLCSITMNAPQDSEQLSLFPLEEAN